MKKIIFIILILFSFNCFSQQKIYFYLELSNLSEAPVVTDNIDGTKTLVTNKSEVNQILKKYLIYEFRQSCTHCKSNKLKNTFEVECNNIQLMYDLRNGFPLIFVNSEQYTAPEILYTPNDYNLTSIPFGFGSSFEKKTLNLIGAENAWDITHGSSNVIIGINEYGINVNHEELLGKVLNPLPSCNYHPTWVAGIAAGSNDNGIGVTSIGFNCRLAQGSITDIINNGGKVINMSWGSPFIPSRPNEVPNITFQNQVNDLSDNSDIVFVAAAGNGKDGNVSAGFLTSNGLAINVENYASQRHYPASNKNVISVSTVGNWDAPNSTAIPFDNWIDIHKIKKPAGSVYNGTYPPVSVTEPEVFHQHNDSVDIVVPAYRLPIAGSPDPAQCSQTNQYFDSATWGGISGTSNSAPIVSGTIGLMFSVNYCLKPKEVESILKLTAVNIENIPENLPFYGRLGGGRLDAFRAVEMANEMAKPFGTVNVIDRILYRNWFYKLETAPFQIKMSNNLVTDGAKIKFFARNNIEILSGDYKPDIGYMDLQINPILSLNCASPTNIRSKESTTVIENTVNGKVKIYPNPNNGTFTISVGLKEVKDLKIEVFDIFGKSVFKTTTNLIDTIITTQDISSGIYLIKLTSNDINEVLKFIKE